MNFLKIKLLVIAVMMFAASSAFASLSYNINIDTNSLNNQDGYLYLQYAGVNAVNSTATVASFTTNGALASTSSLNVVDGSAVSGQLPGNVVFANTNGTNDYNHAIHFGTNLNYNLLFASNNFGVPAGGSSTFSLGLFSDEGGLTPLVTTTGTLFMIDLNNDGTTAVKTLASGVTATPTPIPAAAWLFGSGLMGLIGVRRKKHIYV
jgi:hypothetical protein